MTIVVIPHGQYNMTIVVIPHGQYNMTIVVSPHGQYNMTIVVTPHGRGKKEENVSACDHKHNASSYSSDY